MGKSEVMREREREGGQVSRHIIMERERAMAARKNQEKIFQDGRGLGIFRC